MLILDKMLILDEMLILDKKLILDKIVEYFLVKPEVHFGSLVNDIGSKKMNKKIYCSFW